MKDEKPRTQRQNDDIAAFEKSNPYVAEILGRMNLVGQTEDVLADLAVAYELYESRRYRHV